MSDTHTMPLSPQRAHHARVRQSFLDVLRTPESARAAAVADLEDDIREDVRDLLKHHTEEPLLAARHPSERDPLALEGEVLHDRYRVEERIAEGGFSFVYRGEHLSWKRPIAIKVFKLAGRDDDTEVVREAFIKEGRLLSDLSSRSAAIVQSYDIGTWRTADGHTHLYMVLEWLNGQTLSALQRKSEGHRWTFDELYTLLDPIADGLAVAHNAGVAHRDIKPSNIFVMGDPEVDGHPLSAVKGSKLLDFGIAKVADEYERGFDATTGKMSAFTPGYAPPEQMSRDRGKTGPWSDVYSLALVVSELLCGRRFTQDDDALEVARLLGAPTRPTPRRMGAKIGRASDRVIGKAMALEAKGRFEDVAGFWSALKASHSRRWFA